MIMMRWDRSISAISAWGNWIDYSFMESKDIVKQQLV